MGKLNNLLALGAFFRELLTVVEVCKIPHRERIVGVDNCSYMEDTANYTHFTKFIPRSQPAKTS